MRKPKISMIVAMDEKRGIGKGNEMLWRIREDLVRLRDLTEDRTVIVGRKTYDSLVGHYNRSGRKMPGEIYLVVTRDKSYKPARENAATVGSVEEGIEKAREIDKKGEIFVIGGGQVYEQSITFADRLYLTLVEGDYGATVFFPEYQDRFKRVVKEEEHESEEGINYKFLILES